MSKWKPNAEDRVRTALTIKRYGQSDKPMLELIRELRDNDT